MKGFSRGPLSIAAAIAAALTVMAALLAVGAATPRNAFISTSTSTFAAQCIGVPAAPRGSEDIFRIVSKEVSLPASYVPLNLVLLPDSLVVSGPKRLRQVAAAAVEQILLDARAAGHNIVVSSAYRSYEEQAATYQYWVDVLGEEEASRISARAGHSEHQLGTTVDLTSASVNYQLVEAFGNTAEGQWLRNNAFRYGFALSYPESKEAITGYAYEPWHYRHIGREMAHAHLNSGLTLLEFLTCLQARLASDFSGDGCADVIGPTRDGVLRLYAGNCAGGWSRTNVPIGAGWLVPETFTWLLTPGDFSGDGCADILGVRADDASLRLYEGDCASGWRRTNVQVGSGWGGFSWLLAPGDFSGDGCPDIAGVAGDASLRLYEGDCAGGWRRTFVQIGSGWGAFAWLLAPGDFSSNGCPDVIAATRDGVLRLYEGNCAGSWSRTNVPIGAGWLVPETFTWLLTPGDFSGDGCADIMGVRTDDTSLRLYEGNCAGGWRRTNSQVGSGWGGFEWLLGSGR